MITNQDGRKFVKAVRKRLIVALALIAVCCMAVVAAAASVYTVDVTADGDTKTVKTSARNTDVIIEQAGVSVGDDDVVDLTNFRAGTDSKDGNEIKVHRSQTVKIYDDEELVATVTVAGTVQDALDKAGIKLGEKDIVSPSADTVLTEDQEVYITRSESVKVIADGKTEYVPFTTGTVADVLDRQGISLGKNDEVSPSLDTELSIGDAVVVERVTYKIRVTTETLEYDTVTKSDSTVPSGTTKILQAGENGARTVAYKDKIVDGEVAESEELKEQVLKEPVDQVIAKGTKVAVTATNTISQMSLPSKYTLKDGVPTNALKTITGPATAYSASSGAKCATGVTAQTGYVAVDPKEIPYGSELYIVSADGKQVYGYAIAADTGGFTKTTNVVVDLYMNTNAQCCQWGRRNVVIYVLSWGTGKVK